MEDYTTYVGMDVHKKEISVAIFTKGEDSPKEWKIANEGKSIKRMLKRIKSNGSESVLYCYEAGPMGYTLSRRIRAEGFDCMVVAPSLIPKKPGSRVKTDRRDARNLGSLLRAGLLTEVKPPTEEEEAIRDLCRCRESVRRDLKRSRNRLNHFLIRRGFIYSDGTRWSQKHRVWIRGLEFEHDANGVAFGHYLYLVEQLEEQVRILDRRIEEFADREPYREAVAHLRCFRGIDTVTAMTIATELYGFGRFVKPRELMSFLGLTPSEHSSGDRTRSGSITKCGNAHARRILIEASWHYRHRPSVGIGLRKRRQDQPERVISIADKAQKRLHDRYWRLVSKGKPTNKAVTAVARELVGFIWSALYDPAKEVA